MRFVKQFCLLLQTLSAAPASARPERKKLTHPQLSELHHCEKHSQAIEEALCKFNCWGNGACVLPVRYTYMYFGNSSWDLWYIVHNMYFFVSITVWMNCNEMFLWIRNHKDFCSGKGSANTNKKAYKCYFCLLMYRLPCKIYEHLLSIFLPQEKE